MLVLQLLGDGGNVKEALRRACESECLRDTDECHFILLSLERVSDPHLLRKAARELLELAHSLRCDSAVAELLGVMLNK